MSLSDYEQELVDNIDELGWFCVSVFEGEKAPSFSYTVGLTFKFGVPEFIIFGLSSETGYNILWKLYRELEAGAVGPFDGMVWPDLLNGYDCVSRTVHSSQILRDYFNSALWYRRFVTGRDDDFTACQIFWPGAQQRLLPWQEGCDQFVRDSQPALYLPKVTGLA